MKNFAVHFDEIDLSEFILDALFRELNGWSTLNALTILNIIVKKYSDILRVD